MKKLIIILFIFSSVAVSCFDQKKAGPLKDNLKGKGESVIETVDRFSENICFNGFSLFESCNHILIEELQIEKKLLWTKNLNPYNDICKEYRYQLNEEFVIGKSIINDDCRDDSKYQGIDNIYILEKEFNLVEWINKSTNNSISYIDPIVNAIYKIELEQNDKKYILIQIDDIKRMGVHKSFWVFLFEIEDEKIENTFCLNQKGSILRSNPNYLGDFNYDGFLDFLHLDLLEDSIKFYNIEEDRIVRNYNNFLIIEDCTVENYREIKLTINKTKSKWEFCLDNIYNGCQDCFFQGPDFFPDEQ